MQIKGAVAYKGAADFKIETLELEDPREDEILVRIKGVGICHTDIVFGSGAMPYPFPAVLGHEGSGIVEAVGTKITKVRPGDHVVMTFRSCGACDLCDDGEAAYCRTMPMLNYTGRREDGSSAIRNENGPVGSNFFGQSSFATYALTYERNVVKVDDDLPLELLGPLGCGIQTGAGAILRSLAARPNSTLLVLGGGSVGLSAVMGGKIAGCSTIILVEPQAARRSLGLELGATQTIDPITTDDIAKAVREAVPSGVDYVLDTTGRPDVQAAAMAALGGKGVFGLVGISPPDAPTPGLANGLMAFGQSVRGIIEGDSDPDTFIPEMIDHYRAGRLPFDKLIKTYSFDDINTAIADQHSGACVKAVLIPDA
ncbi:MAG: NAD(P)-dependent alcohol dehydrogenase [Pseudomonadota bacterium]